MGLTILCLKIFISIVVVLISCFISRVHFHSLLLFIVNCVSIFSCVMFRFQLSFSICIFISYVHVHSPCSYLFPYVVFIIYINLLIYILYKSYIHVIHILHHNCSYNCCKLLNIVFQTLLHIVKDMIKQLWGMFYVQDVSLFPNC
jgi:hypothetical protein